MCTQAFTLGKSKLLGVLLLLCSSFISLEQNKRLRSKKSGLAIRDLDFWVLSLGRSQGGNHWFLGWFSRVLCAALTLPHRLIKQTPSPQGAQTEDIANTEGKHKQEVIILPNSHNYSDKKSYSKGMLPRLLVLQLKPASPIHYLSLNFQKRGGKPSTNPSLKKQMLARETPESASLPQRCTYILNRENSETNSSLKFHLKVLQHP